MISKTTTLGGRKVDVVFLPDHKSTLEDYARAYIAEGLTGDEVEQLVIGLLWSSLFLGTAALDGEKE